MVDYKVSKSNGFRCIFYIFTSFSKHSWGVPLKKRNLQTLDFDFSKTLTTSNCAPNNIGSDRGAECYNNNFQN